jgi:hypothetical protein
MPERQVVVGSAVERRSPSTDMEAQLPHSSASLLEDSLNQAEEWVSAMSAYFLHIAARCPHRNHTINFILNFFYTMQGMLRSSGPDSTMRVPKPLLEASQHMLNDPSSLELSGTMPGESY